MTHDFQPGEVRAQMETFGSDPTKELFRSLSNKYFDWRGIFEGNLSLKENLLDSVGHAGNADLVQQSIEAYEAVCRSRNAVLATIDSFVIQVQADL